MRAAAQSPPARGGPAPTPTAHPRPTGSRTTGSSGSNARASSSHPQRRGSRFLESLQHHARRFDHQHERRLVLLVALGSLLQLVNDVKRPRARPSSSRPSGTGEHRSAASTLSSPSSLEQGQLERHPTRRIPESCAEFVDRPPQGIFDRQIRQRPPQARCTLLHRLCAIADRRDGRSAFHRHRTLSINTQCLLDQRAG